MAGARQSGMLAITAIRKVDMKAAIQVLAIRFLLKVVTQLHQPGLVAQSSKTQAGPRKRRSEEHSVFQSQGPPVSARMPAFTGMM